MRKGAGFRVKHEASVGEQNKFAALFSQYKTGSAEMLKVAGGCPASTPICQIPCEKLVDIRKARTRHGNLSITFFYVTKCAYFGWV